jgi:hypothetical protein
VRDCFRGAQNGAPERIWGPSWLKVDAAADVDRSWFSSDVMRPNEFELIAVLGVPTRDSSGSTSANNHYVRTRFAGSKRIRGVFELSGWIWIKENAIEGEANRRVPASYSSSHPPSQALAGCGKTEFVDIGSVGAVCDRPVFIDFWKNGRS